MILDVSSRHKASAPFSDKDGDIVNFADAFQGKDLDVENLVFEGEDGNNKIENKDGVIKDEEQAELRAVISNNLSFTIVIPRRQGSKEIDNNTRRYNLRRLVRGIR